jgi:hypothetical protein
MPKRLSETVEKWLEPQNRILLSGWARDGLSNDQIAQNIGISKSTLLRWRNANKDFNNMLMIEKARADYIVESALFKACKAGNVEAIKYYLNNRRPDKWRRAPLDSQQLSTPAPKQYIFISEDYHSDDIPAQENATGDQNEQSA